jgi:hypothetical protein
VAPAAPALGPKGTVSLLLFLLGAAFWSMTRRSCRGASSHPRNGVAAGTQMIALCLLAGTAGCSAEADRASSPPTEATGREPSPGSLGGTEDTGNVGMDLTLPGGENISVINWAITGPNGAATVVQSSSVKVQALALKFLVSSLPAGSGYRVTLSGTSTDDSVTCSGAAPFAVTAHATTNVSVQMACGAVGTGGHGTSVNGSTFNCAAWSSVTANPTETKVGSSVALAATASGPDPTMLTYAWSASSGSLGSPSAATSSFTCAQAGAATVTLTVGDGPVPAGSTCNPSLDTTTVTVTCDPATVSPPPPAAPALPPWGCLMLVAGILGIGTAFARRASGLPEIG